MMTFSKESKIREGFIRVFKEHIGKGPRNTEVRIFKKMVIVIMQDVLTELEKNLISYGDHEAVMIIRDKIAEPAIPKYKAMLEQETGKQVSDMMSKHNLEANERYYVFIFEENIES